MLLSNISLRSIRQYILVIQKYVQMTVLILIDFMKFFFCYFLLHSGTEREEHIQIIINSTQEADIVIPTQDRPCGLSLSTIWVRVIKTAGNTRIQRPHVFHVRSGPNQLYSPEYGWDFLSPCSTRKLKGRTS